jgi:hypothetical protein
LPVSTLHNSPGTLCGPGSSRRLTESGAALLRIADQSRHKSLDVLRGYVRRADMFKDHAGAAFL